MNSETVSVKSQRENVSFWVIKLEKEVTFQELDHRRVGWRRIWKYWTPLWDLLPNPFTGLLDDFQPRIWVSSASLRTPLGLLIIVQRNEHLIGRQGIAKESESASEPGELGLRPSQLCHLPAVWTLADDPTFVGIIFLIFTFENNIRYFLELRWSLCDRLAPIFVHKNCAR